MENRETLTDITWRKMYHVWILFPCLALIAYSRIKLIDLLDSVPYDTLANFAWEYMQSDNHQVFFILSMILLTIATMIISTYLLIKSFRYEEKQGKILNVVLILVNISVIATTILSNLIIFKIIFMMILISLGIAFMFSAIGSSKSDNR
jgi:uncharacterized membrane protein